MTQTPSNIQKETPVSEQLSGDEKKTFEMITRMAHDGRHEAALTALAMENVRTQRRVQYFDDLKVGERIIEFMNRLDALEQEVSQ